MHCDLASFEASADGHKYCLVCAVTIEVNGESKLLPFFVPMPKKDAACAVAALKGALTVCDNRNLRQITGSRIARIQADGGGEFTNQKVRDLCWEKSITLSYSSSSAIIQWHIRTHDWNAQDHSPQNAQTSQSRQRMVVICMSLRRPHDERESSKSRMATSSIKKKSLFGQLVGIWKSHDKADAKSLDDRGCVGYLLDIDIWQSGTTRIMQDGVEIKGLAPRCLDPVKYHLNPNTDLNELEKGMPWRMIQDEFGKLKWVDHAGRIYQGTPFSVEPDVTSKHIFVASMMHTSMRSPVLRDRPDVTCPSDFPDSERRKEVVHHEQITDQDMSKTKKQTSDKKSNVVIKAKGIPVTPKSVASSQGATRERWLVSIDKEIENFLQNMAIEDADPSLISSCQMEKFGSMATSMPDGIHAEATDTSTASE